MCSNLCCSGKDRFNLGIWKFEDLKMTLLLCNKRIKYFCIFEISILIVMDIAAQIKNNLIERIKNSNDLNFLRAIQTIFDTSDQSLYKLSDEQGHAIQKGREQIASGNFKDHEDVMSEMKAWLANK